MQVVYGDWGIEFCFMFEVQEFDGFVQFQQVGVGVFVDCDLVFVVSFGDVFEFGVCCCFDFVEEGDCVYVLDFFFQELVVILLVIVLVLFGMGWMIWMIGILVVV